MMNDHLQRCRMNAKLYKYFICFVLSAIYSKIVINGYIHNTPTILLLGLGTKNFYSIYLKVQHTNSYAVVFVSIIGSEKLSED